MKFTMLEAIKLGVGIYVGMMLCEGVVKVAMLVVFGLASGLSRGAIAGL